MGAFEDLHRDRITGSLAMFDRMIFKGHLTALYKQDGARCFLWSQGVALKDFTGYAKATTERIANNARKSVTPCVPARRPAPVNPPIRPYGKRLRTGTAIVGRPKEAVRPADRTPAGFRRQAALGSGSAATSRRPALERGALPCGSSGYVVRVAAFLSSPRRGRRPSPGLHAVARPGW
jgi:hypothetical protein